MAAEFDSTMIETDEGLLDDVIIQFETIEDTFEKAIVRYDYPFADGADLEDMGQKAHAIRFRCWFWDDEENISSYEEHTRLLAALAKPGLIDFVHPKYGLIRGKIESIAINHNADVRTAAIEVTFVEQMRAELSVETAPSVQSAVEEAYSAAQAKEESLLTTALAAIPGVDPAAVSTALNTAQGLLTQMQGYTSATRAAVAEIEKHLAKAEATVSRVASPLNSLQATLTYGLALPGRVLGSLSGVLERTARTFDSLWNFPSQFVAKLDDALGDLEDSFADLADGATSPAGRSAGLVMRNHLLIAGAQRLALEAAALFAEDDRAARDAGESGFEVMTITELEATLAVVRTRLAAAVAVAREMDELKEMAASLLAQVNTVRLEREKLMNVTLDNPLPIHLVCLRYGLSYSDAERLIRVNRISKPNYVAGEVAVYVR
jgi:prophage DNA circulation protein